MIRSITSLVFLQLTSISVYCTDIETSSAPPSSEPPVIEEINISIHPVFDESNPKENNFLFRLVNRLHINTKKRVIEKDLSFKKGDPLDRHLLEESERRLRNQRYFAEAKVTAPKINEDSRNAGQPVQVEVREVWTLIPKLTYSSAGGQTHYGYGLHDSNFLGLGKTVKVEQSSSVERTSSTLVYRDPNFGTGQQLALGYSNNSDGKEQELHLSNPFRSIRTSWTAGVDVHDFDREDALYNAGEDSWRFGHQATYNSLYYGQRLDFSTDDRTHRWMLGWDSVADDFYPVPAAPENRVDHLPMNRNYQVAWLEYSYRHNHFSKTTNVQQINRVEDINLGSQWRARVGSVAADDEKINKSITVQLDYSKAFQLSPSQLLTSEFSTSGFYDNKKSTHSIANINLNYHWQNFSRGQFFIMAKETYGKNLFEDMPLELGGDTGLRGYPARFMAGEHLRLVTMEQRYFGETEWFSLFHLGAALFYDQGKVWGATQVPQDYQQTLRNVGFGLRISGTRTGGQDDGAHNVGHIDVAYPLDRLPGVDKYQISVRIKTGF